jgi:hypothetical protein
MLTTFQCHCMFAQRNRNLAIISWELTNMGPQDNAELILMRFVTMPHHV